MSEVKLSTIGRPITEEEFGKIFFSFERSAIRWETQARFNVESDLNHVVDFLAGKPCPPDLFKDWRETIRSWVSEGKNFGLVRYLPEDPTDYLRYEIAWGYPGNEAVGQKMAFFIGDSAVEGPLKSLIGQDFWLIDDRILLHIDYDSEGSVKGYFAIDDEQFVSLVALAMNEHLSKGVTLDFVLKNYV